MKEQTVIYFIGTAGSGKSTLTNVYQQWCRLRGLDAIIVNLDPGAESLPYDPDVDIRDWISLHEVMETQQLGPNGAQIVCADMIALNIEEIQKSIAPFKSDYILIDTPGQLELFVFRESGKYTVNQIYPKKSMICYIIDPILARSSSGFVTQLLLSITTNFRLNQPQVNVLSKADLLTDSDREIISKWSSDPEELYGAVIQEEASIFREMSEGLLLLMKDFGGHTQLVPVSKEGYEGVEDLYTTIQLEFQGGEDLTKD